MFDLQAFSTILLLAGLAITVWELPNIKKALMRLI